MGSLGKGERAGDSFPGRTGVRHDFRRSIYTLLDACVPVLLRSGVPLGDSTSFPVRNSPEGRRRGWVGYVL